MGGYTNTSPITDAHTETDGTTVAQVAAIPRGDNYNAPGTTRLPAFLGLAKLTGGVYAENTTTGMTVERALESAGLNFAVTKHEFGSNIHDRKATGVLPYTWVPGANKLRNIIATWPDGRMQSMGVSGSGYQVVQPHDAATFGQAVLEEGGATVVASAGYGDPQGSRMYLALKMPEGIQVGGEDPHDLYLTIGNSFNRETGLWGCVAPIRVKCTNQAAMTFGALSNRFIIRHTGDITSKVNEVQRALDMTGTFSQAYAAAAELMLATPMAGREVDEFLNRLMPTPTTVTTARGEDSWDDRRRSIRNLITDGEYNAFGRGTRYAAYQGVAEWADHYFKASSQLSRYARMVDGGKVEELKTAAGELLMTSA